MKKLIALTLVGCSIVGGTFAFRPMSVEVGAFRPMSIENNVETVNETQEAGMRPFRY